MKVPLRFQVTDFDCGTVSLTNAFSYLFEREEIPAELIRGINMYTLDCYDLEGNLGQGGTSREAINMLARWITNFANSKENFNVVCYYYEKEQVNRKLLDNCLLNNCVLFVRCWQTTEHYCIITNIDQEYAYFFDPYYFEMDYYKSDREIEMIFDKPFNYNRKVKIERLFSETTEDFSLGKIDKRECVVIKRR